MWLTVVFAAWFAATCASELLGIRGLRRWDPLRLLPGYRLFSGLPRDIQLRVLSLGADGSVLAARDIRWQRPARLAAAVWSPDVDRLDILRQHAVRLYRHLNRGRIPAATLPLQLEWRVLSRYARQLPHPAATTAFTFALIEPQPGGADTVLFVSTPVSR